MPSLTNTYNIDSDGDLTPPKRASDQTVGSCKINRALTDTYTINSENSPSTCILSTSYTISACPSPASSSNLSTSYTIVARPSTPPSPPQASGIELRNRTDERCIRRLWFEHRKLDDNLHRLDALIADRQQQRNIFASGTHQSLRAHIIATNQLRSKRQAKGRRAEAIQAQLDDMLGWEARTGDGPMADNITLLASRVAVGQIELADATELVMGLQCGRLTMPMVGRMYAAKPPAWTPTEQQMGEYMRLERAAALEMHVHLWRKERMGDN